MDFNRRQKIRWKQDLNLRGETPSDKFGIQITRLNDSAIPAWSEVCNWVFRLLKRSKQGITSTNTSSFFFKLPNPFRWLTGTAIFILFFNYGLINTIHNVGRLDGLCGQYVCPKTNVELLPVHVLRYPLLHRLSFDKIYHYCKPKTETLPTP